MVAPPPIHIESPRFVGSLGTLFNCARANTVDLRDVPLLPVCEAYLVYMVAGATTDLDEAGAALAALAYLLERKAWALLPLPDVEPNAEPLLELPSATTYEYRAAIDALKIWHEERSLIYFRAPNLGPNPYELPYDLEELTIGALAASLETLLRRLEPPTPPELGRPRRSLATQMSVVLLAISYDWRTFADLVPLEATREDAVYWFLSILELMRLGQISARLDGQEVEFARA